LDREEFTYCEGYAISVIPVAHAWCLDGQGNVVDPTWSGRLPCSDYFGLAFQTRFLRHQILENKYWGLIDAWRNDWPLLTGPVGDWRNPIMDRFMEGVTTT
jgi:hypothetical protein